MHLILFRRHIYSALFLVCALIALNSLSVPALAQDGEETSTGNILLILDASGSMWGQIEGENKISIAKDVLKELASELPDGTEVGLIAYGHREKGDCEDIETIVEIGPIDKAALNEKIDALNPKGKTPITDSVLMAFESVKATEDAVTVILVSDGIETCGGDPCKAVKEAKDSGINFIMHVVGFDVGDVDVSQLECAAQAGGGLYMSAQNASELSEALETAVEIPVEPASGKLSVKVTAEGKLQDAVLVLTNTQTGEELKGQRTYSKPETNPRVISLPDGVYDLEIRPSGMKGVQSKTIEGIEIVSGETVEKEVEFGFGELSIKVLRNEKLSDATVEVVNPETQADVAKGRTYKKPNTNPLVLKIEPGVYEVKVTSVEIASGPVKTLSSIEIVSGGTVEHVIDFSSGTLKVGALQGEKLIDAVVRITDSSTGEQVKQGRTYKDAKTNPKVFELVPGVYDVSVEPVGIGGDPKEVYEGVEIIASETVEKSAQFASGTLKIGALQGEKLLDAVVYVKNPDTGGTIAQGRTYKSSKTNPKAFELPPGVYDVTVEALGIENDPVEEYQGVEISGGETVLKEAQFQTGVFKIGAKDGERLLIANIDIHDAKTGERITTLRTQKKAASNPKSIELTPGTYDLTVTAINMNDKPKKEFQGVELNAGGDIEEIVQFPSGTVKVSASSSGLEIVAKISIQDPDTEEEIVYGYTGSKPTNNQVEFVITPGNYNVIVTAGKLEGKPQEVYDIELKAGDMVELDADFTQ